MTTCEWAGVVIPIASAGAAIGIAFALAWAIRSTNGR